MTFTLPQFNLTCRITDGKVWPPVGTRLTSLCNLALGKRVTVTPEFPFVNQCLAGQMTLLLPPLTDIRDAGHAVNVSWGDYVEVPITSGRWYAVTYVDDIGKGFANEHRFAWLMKAVDVNDSTNFITAVWPTPIP